MSAGEDQSVTMLRELANMICGALIGSGAGRQVYAHAQDPQLVVKFESTAGSFQNVIEWQTWEAVKETDLAEWFAPCVAISPCGCVLIQRRTTPASDHPELVPAFFTDLKLANFGMLMVSGREKARFVCHDYGLHLMLEKGMTKRLRRAGWWNL